ncbi:MAG: MBL fold metallo-hydrolase [Proteobacteria bacterium]|nr:MBL fold metallo-hydrolase [Pseudomonadota bacterium]
MDTFCYIITDEANQTAAVIDPAFDTDKILKIVSDDGSTITHLINTHCHSDHTSGNAAILSATNAQLCIHKQDADNLSGFLNKTFSLFLGGKGSPRPDILLEDGNEILIGKTKLRILHTPGHTKGGICIYTDGNVITGDTLFVGAVGRTDLPGGSFEKLYASIHQKIYTLPDETIVWPGHDYGSTPHSTVGQERNTNPFTR